MFRFLIVIVVLILLIFGGLLVASNINEKDHSNTIVVLGADLNDEQKQEMLDHFGIREIEEVEVMEVTNEEEHHYLDGIANFEQIGSNALSSVSLKKLPDGSGIQVETYNITWVSPEMYTTALLTAGADDMNISVAAPMPVSGTAGLTGAIKAFEDISGEKLLEENKEVAHEEIVVMSDIAEGGEEHSADLLQEAKKEILANRPMEQEEIKKTLDRLIDEKNVNIGEDNYKRLLELLLKFNSLDVDADSLSEKLDSASDNVGFLSNLLKQITGFFSD